MRVFVTGGAGFIGRSVVRQLLVRGDSVTAVVRDPSAGAHFGGAHLIAGDLGDVPTIESQLRDHDAVVHVAGSYRIGIRPEERRPMWEANVGTTQRVLKAASQARIPRTVYVSTVNVFGNTRGRLVDETFVRDPRQGFLSWYDETKWQAHLVAVGHINVGDPVVIAMPGGVYGPGDHTQVGVQLRQAYEGTLRYRALDDVGVTWGHVDDIAAGILGVLDRGRVGESYVLAGPAHRLRDVIAVAAALGRHRPPALAMPSVVLRAIAPLADRLSPSTRASLGLRDNLGEVLSASSGVTYWATAEKARAELGFRARDLRTGLRDWLVLPEAPRSGRSDGGDTQPPGGDTR
jgi:nucleoside-diphosphate-sugar epimerase